jgi:hypothetical protein
MNTLLTKMVDLIETTIVTGAEEIVMLLWKKIFKDDLVFGVGSIFGDRLD